MSNMYINRLLQLKAAMEAEHLAALQARKKTLPVQPLVDQVRDYLATLPDAQKSRISLPMLLPHLQGKYREQPHLLHLARAMRQIGYFPVRSWKKADAGARYWVKESAK